MSINEAIVVGTTFVTIVAGLVGAISKLWSEIKKLREEFLGSKITLTQLDQQSTNQHAAETANLHVTGCKF